MLESTEKVEVLDFVKASISNSHVQLIVLCNDGVEEYLNKKLKDSSINSFDRIEYISSDNNLSQTIIDKVKGKYLSFTLCCLDSFGSSINKIVKFCNARNEDILLTKFKTDNMLVKEVDEHNLFHKIISKNVNSNPNVNMVYNLFPCYIFKAATFEIQTDFSKNNWKYDVLSLVINNVFNKQKKIKSINASIEIYEKNINELFFINPQTKIEAQNLISDFLNKLKKMQNWNSIEFRSEYVLLYYLVRLSKYTERVTGSGEIADENIVNFINDEIKNIHSTEVIEESLYVDPYKKYYLLTECFEQNKEEVRKKHIPPSEYIATMKYYENLGDLLHLEYSVEEPFDVIGKVYIRRGDKVDKPSEIKDFGTRYWNNISITQKKLYIFDINIDESDKSLSLVDKLLGEEYNLTNTKYGPFTPFSIKAFHYSDFNGKLLSLDKDKSTLKIRNNSLFKRIALGIHQNASLLKSGIPGVKALLVRRAYRYKVKRKKKQIWLFSDRINRADDNGEVLFEYVNKNSTQFSADSYFVIDHSVDDYERMKKIGNVLDAFGKKHKMLFLLNDYSFSSQANEMVVNPFRGYEYLYRDIVYKKRLVFLQHGITKDNQSRWLNKYNRNLYGFIVTTHGEYDSVFTYDYYYKPERVWLTGMPRYDKLYHDEKKYITVMPTWRKTLSAGVDENGIWILGEDFKRSEYFCFYNALLNNDKLIAAADKFGYTICFMPHPNTLSGIGLFDHNSKVKFLDMNYSYRDVFAWTDLMVTDYSSVAFDFAYLRKPIVYSQFDKEDFFNGGHSYTEGYFNYETDGFGEVEDSLEAVVDRLIEYMESGCMLKTVYRDRIDKTFAFNDTNCCERLFSYIN